MSDDTIDWIDWEDELRKEAKQRCRVGGMSEEKIDAAIESEASKRAIEDAADEHTAHQKTKLLEDSSTTTLTQFILDELKHRKVQGMTPEELYSVWMNKTETHISINALRTRLRNMAGQVGKSGGKYFWIPPALPAVEPDQHGHSREESSPGPTSSRKCVRRSALIGTD